jgi:hypothetical protein
MSKFKSPQYTIKKVLKNKYWKWNHIFHLELWMKIYRQKKV